MGQSLLIADTKLIVFDMQDRTGNSILKLHTVVWKLVFQGMQDGASLGIHASRVLTD